MRERERQQVDWSSIVDGKYLRRRLCRVCYAACERRPTRRCPSWSSWDRAACAVDAAGGPSHSIGIVLRGSTCATLPSTRESRNIGLVLFDIFKRERERREIKIGYSINFWFLCRSSRRRSWFCAHPWKKEATQFPFVWIRLICKRWFIPFPVLWWRMAGCKTDESFRLKLQIHHEKNQKQMPHRKTDE